MDDIAVFFHSECFHLTGLSHWIAPQLLLFGDFVHPLVGGSSVIVAQFVLGFSRFEYQFELLLSFSFVELEFVEIFLLMGFYLVETHRFVVLPDFVETLFSHFLLRFQYPLTNSFSFCLNSGYFWWNSDRKDLTYSSFASISFYSSSRFFLRSSILWSISCRLARSFICMASFISFYRSA